jgi:hypothetical protein
MHVRAGGQNQRAFRHGTLDRILFPPVDQRLPVRRVALVAEVFGERRVDEAAKIFRVVLRLEEIQHDLIQPAGKAI